MERWGDPRTGYKDVEIFVYNLTPENQQLRGKMIDGWKVYGVWKALTPEDIDKEENSISMTPTYHEKYECNVLNFGMYQKNRI